MGSVLDAEREVLHLFVIDAAGWRRARDVWLQRGAGRDEEARKELVVHPAHEHVTAHEVAGGGVGALREHLIDDLPQLLETLGQGLLAPLVVAALERHLRHDQALQHLVVQFEGLAPEVFWTRLDL